MTQLAAAVNSTEELWTVDTLPTAPYATVGSETVSIRAKFPSQTFSLTGQATLTQIRVDRGVGGTTAASHTNGSALTPVYGLGGGAGGGVTNDAPADAIAVSDGTNLTGSANLTVGGDLVSEIRLQLADIENGTALITALGLGSQIQLIAADGDEDHVGGELVLQSGSSGGQSGGQVTIQAGNDGLGGDGGGVDIYSGQAADGTSGEINIKTGAGVDTGGIRLEPGLASDGDAGGVDIVAGTSTNGTSGWASLQSSDGKQVYIDSTGIYLYGLPAADPEIANALFTDGAPGAGAPVALKISGGPA